MSTKDANALQLVNHSKVIIWSMDMGGTFTYCRGKALTDRGFKDGEFVGKNFFELFKDHPRAIDGIKKVMAGEELEQDHQLGDRCYMNQAAPVRDSEGKVVGVAGVSTEITHRRHLQSLVEDQKEEFQQIIDIIPQQIWSANQKGEIDYVSPRFIDYAVTRDLKDLLGWNWLKIIHPDDLKRVKEDWVFCLTNGLCFSTEYRFKNVAGEYHWLRVQCIPHVDKDGKVIKFYGTCTDIEKEKSVERSLKAAHQDLEAKIRERTEQLTRAENDRMNLIREQARLKEREYYLGMSNFLGEATQIMGSSLDYQEALKKLTEFLIPGYADWGGIAVITRDGKYERIGAAHKDPEKQKVLREKLENLPMAVDYVLKEKKSLFHPQVTPEMITKESKNPGIEELIRYIGIKSVMVVPIVHREKLLGTISLIRSEGRPYKEDDLSLIEELSRRVGTIIENAFLYRAAKEAIESRDEFISMASHELKTPISSLKLQLQMTQRNVHPETGETIPAPKLMKALDNSSEYVNRLNALVEDLLDVTRIESGRLQYNFEQLDVSELTQKTVEQYKNQLQSHGTQVSFSSEGTALVNGDRHRLEQVVVNLLTNAGKYGAKKPVEVRVRFNDKDAIIDVIDHGIGIPKEKLQTVFERFERVDAGGSISGLGLGLFITREIVKAHKGRMHVESTPGMGSTFSVYLPLAPQH